MTVAQVTGWLEDMEVFSLRGGARPGSGRPKGPEKRMRSWRLTDAEYQKVKGFVNELRRREQ